MAPLRTAVGLAVLASTLGSVGSAGGATAADIPDPAADSQALLSVARDGVASVTTHGPRSERVIALTIDDGYDTDTCLEMAAILERKGAVATFFPIGKNIRAHPEAWADIGRRFPLASHTMFHGILPPLSIDRIRHQIGAARQWLGRVTDVPVLPYLRPPGGAYDDRVRRIAGDMGIQTLVAWDTTAADTALGSRPSGMVRSALRGGPGSIVLMHCNRPLSAQLLRRIIDGYRARGFRFVTVPELLSEQAAEAMATPLPPIDTLGIGLGTRASRLPS